MISHQEQILGFLKEGGQKNTRVKEVRPNTYQVILPFYHSDGDVIEVFVQEQGGKRFVTDMGLTLMRLSYVTDIDTENKRKVYNDTLSHYGADERSGKIIIEIPSIQDIYPYLMQMITVILKVSDITLLSRESVRINFYQYFSNFVDTELSHYNFKKEYQAPFDTRGLYTIPYHSTTFNSLGLLFLIPIQGDYKCQEYTTNLLQLKNNGIKHKSITVFEDMSTIHSKTLARYVDVADKQFSSLDGNQDQIKEYLKELSR